MNGQVNKEQRLVEINNSIKKISRNENRRQRALKAMNKAKEEVKQGKIVNANLVLRSIRKIYTEPKVQPSDFLVYVDEIFEEIQSRSDIITVADIVCMFNVRLLRDGKPPIFLTQWKRFGKLNNEIGFLVNELNEYAKYNLIDKGLNRETDSGMTQFILRNENGMSEGGGITIQNNTLSVNTKDTKNMSSEELKGKVLDIINKDKK